MKSKRRGIIEIERAEEAIVQRNSLLRVRAFLADNDADEALVDAVDEAIFDIEQWIDPEIELAVGQPSGTA